METLPMSHKLTTIGEQHNPFGGIEATFKLDIWQDDAGKLLVRLANDDGEFETYANETFPNCETQHSDSERWLNDKIGYPNPFVGILLHQDWA